MLLLLLRIFFQYDLLLCSKTANGKDEFMDYSITKFWWNGTPGIEQTDRITPEYAFLPTPIGWLLNEDNTPHPHASYRPPEEEGPPISPPISAEDYHTPDYSFYPFPNMTRPSNPFGIEKNTALLPSRPEPNLPSHVQYPGLTPPPNFPPHYRYPTIYQYVTESYIPSPTGPTPKRPTFTFPEVRNPKISTSTTPYRHPPGYVTSTPDWISTTPSRPLPDDKSYDSSRENPFVKHWQEKIDAFTADDNRTVTKVVPKISEVFHYDYTILEAVRRNAKITQDAGSKFKDSVFKDRTQFSPREDLTVTERKEARHSKFQDETSSYDSSEEFAIQKRSKHTQTLTNVPKQSQNTDNNRDIKKITSRTNELKFLSVMKMLERPATVPRGEWWRSDQIVTRTPTTIKQFF